MSLRDPPQAKNPAMQDSIKKNAVETAGKEEFILAIVVENVYDKKVSGD